jgi:hypothetical protein
VCNVTLTIFTHSLSLLLLQIAASSVSGEGNFLRRVLLESHYPVRGSYPIDRHAVEQTADHEVTLHTAEDLRAFF